MSTSWKGVTGQRGIATENLLAIAVQAADAGVGCLRARFGHVQCLGHKSSRTDPVTEADRESEAAVAACLRAARPGDALLGEEGTNDTGDTGLRWVVDPLDGTVNYLYQAPRFAVSIACEEWNGGEWQSVAGVVVDVASDAHFTAARGKGAWCDGRRLFITRPARLDQALVGTGFSYDAERRGQQGVILARLLPRVRDIRSSGSAALDLCWVAAGRYDAYYEDDLGRWDWAAAGLIASEAGAGVVSLGRGVLAAPGALLDSLWEAVTAEE